MELGPFWNSAFRDERGWAAAVAIASENAGWKANGCAGGRRFHAAGAALETIYFYTIAYRYPGPDEDAFAVLKAQSGPPDWDKDGPIWRYEVASRDLSKLSDEKRVQVRDKIAQSSPNKP